MVEHMEKRKMIELKEEGYSNREVARQTGFDRDTVSKYWSEYRRRLQQLEDPGADRRAIQDSLFATPKRASAPRTRHKYTAEVDARLRGILKEEEKKTCHMAVLSSPGGGFRWLYLYKNQKKAVFMDSHVQFFEMMGGSYFEIVYDNMRNVVKKFIGKNEKELNEYLLKMALYYGFRVNVTNCFKGNEKGHVESSVKILRNRIFADHYTFNTLEDAQEYAYSQLIKMNENSRMDEERQALRPYRPPLELGELTKGKVDPCSFVSVDTVKYSVPEYLVGKKVFIKKYHDEIRMIAGCEIVAKHKRAFGNGTMQVDIYHSLNTLLKKPGAVRNSVALKSIPRLKAIFDTYYSNQPKKFIELFLMNKELPIDGIIAMFERETANKGEIDALDVVKPVSQMIVSTRAFIAGYAALTIRGARQ